MKLLFSTAAVHPRDRLAYWREEATKAFVRHEFSTKSGRNFSGQISAGSLGKLQIAAFQSDPCSIARTERCLKSATDDDVLLCRQMGGRVHIRTAATQAMGRVMFTSLTRGVPSR